METKIIFTKDKKAATIYIMKVFHCSVDEVWNHFTQADLLNKWWAPKPWKCETLKMEFEPGGFWYYAMIGPENEKHFGGAKYHEINYHRSFDFTDFFTDENGNMNTALPTTKSLIGFTGVAQGTKLTINNHFNSPAEMLQILGMGAEQGFTAALNQLEKLLNKKD